MDMATALAELGSTLLAAEGDQAGIEVHQEAGAYRLADLIRSETLARLSPAARFILDV